MALATAGIVVGLYHRCGFDVSVARPSTSWTTMTLRFALGAAASMLFMKLSYPTPFCTMSWALATSSATLALASKVWGSVLGLFKIDETDTYFPPIWLRTLAYSFSAPIATITWDELAPAGPATRDPSDTMSAATLVAKTPFNERRFIFP